MSVRETEAGTSHYQGGGNADSMVQQQMNASNRKAVENNTDGTNGSQSLKMWLLLVSI